MVYLKRGLVTDNSGTQTHYRSFIKDNAIVIGGHILVYLKGIIIMPIIIKSVGVTTYGGYILLTSILGIAFAVSSLGAGFKARRFMPSAKRMTERRDLFYPQFYFNILTILILACLFVLLEKQLNTYLLKNEVIFSIWLTLLYLLSYLFYSQGSDYFRYTSRVHYMTLASLCFPYMDIGFTLLYLYAFGPISVNMLLVSTTLSALLIAIPTFGVILRELGLRISFYEAKSLISDIKLGFPVMFGFILDFILAGSDRYWIAFYLSVTDVGYYVPAYVLGSLIVFVPKALGAALPQLLSRAVDSGKEHEAHTMLNYAIKIFLLLAIPFIFGCLALSKPLLTLLANQEVAEKAFLVSPIVALGTLFYGLTLLFSNVLFVRLKTSAIFQINSFAALFNFLANMILFLFFKDIIVAALTTLLSYLIAFLYAYRLVTKVWPLDFNSVTLAKVVAASLVMYLAMAIMLSYIDKAGYLLICTVSFLIGIFTYGLALFALRILTSHELQFIKRSWLGA